MILYNGLIYGFPSSDVNLGFSNSVGSSNNRQYVKPVDCPNFVAERGDAYVCPFSNLSFSMSFTEAGDTFKNNALPTTSNSISFLLGSGSTPVTVNDQGLEDLIWHTTDSSTQYLQQIDGKAKGIIEGSEKKFRVYATFYNGTTETFFVNEIGIGAVIGDCRVLDGTGENVYLNRTDANTNKTNICLVREVLPETVTIAPDETYTFVLEFAGFPLGASDTNLPEV